MIIMARERASTPMKGLVLVLDAMGVIYEAADDVVELLLPFIAEKGGREDPEKVKSLYTRASLGGMETDEFWAAVGLSPAVEEEYLARHRLRDGLLDFLRDPPPCVEALWCLSNDISRWSQKLRARFALDRFFAGFVISGDVGSRKPDAGIFTAFLERAGCRAADCVFVDDRAANLETAARLGFQAVRFGATGIGGDGDYPAVSSFVQLAVHLGKIGK